MRPVLGGRRAAAQYVGCRYMSHVPRSRRALLGLLALVAIVGCGSIHRAGQTVEPSGGEATVSGHLSWPDCSDTGAACPPTSGVPVHFADASARRTFTAISDGSGAYVIKLPTGSYEVIAGDADRSPYARQVTVKPGDTIKLDLRISLPTGA